MVPLSILGLNWCQHAAWMLMLYDSARRRRLQVTLRLEDAVVVGQELARQRSDRSGLYMLVGSVLSELARPANIRLALADGSHATATLVLHTDEGQKPCATSTADAVALAVRVGLPIYADEALMATFGVDDTPDPAERAEETSDQMTTIPQAFRLALDNPPGGEAT